MLSYPGVSFKTKTRSEPLGRRRRHRPSFGWW